MEERDIESLVEGILFASGDPVSVSRIAQAAGLEKEDVERAAELLADRLNFERRGIRLIRLEDKLQLCTRSEHAEIIRRVLETRRPPALSQAALEALAIVAYRQPVTRAYVEQIRGVDSAGTMGLLADKGLIEECGRLEVPGRPILYRTTDAFLRSFGLSELDKLPSLDPEEQLSFPLDGEES